MGETNIRGTDKHIEIVQNRESEDIGIYSYKRVMLYDSDGNEIIPAGSAGTLGEGRKVVTTAGTRVALAASTVCKRVMITAEHDNTNPVTVGGAGVIGAAATREGTPLLPYQSMTLHVTNLNLVYLDSITNGEGVTFTYEV